jgi:hypothetical protein
VAAVIALITLGGYTRRVDMEGTVLPNTGVIAITVPSRAESRRSRLKKATRSKRGLRYTRWMSTLSQRTVAFSSGSSMLRPANGTRSRRRSNASSG